MALSSRLQIALITTVVALGGFIFGVDSGIIATTLGQRSFVKYMYGSKGPNPAFSGALVSGYNAGQAVGTFVSGYLADKLSRKYSLTLAAIIATIGGAVQAGSVSIGMMIAGRAVAGISSGMLLALVPVYISEIAPPQKRGFMVGTQGLMSALGFCMSNWIGYAGSFAKGDAAWRIPLAMQVPAPILMLIGCCFIPFSPRWLMKQERYEEAKAVLIQIQGHMGQEFVDREFVQIQEQITFEVVDNHLPWYKATAALFTPKYIKRTFLACFVVAMSQLSGTSVISNFQNAFYGIVGVRGRQALLVSGIYGIMGVIGTVACLVFVADKWKRTTTLWIGSLTMSATLSVCMALSAEFPAGSTNKSGGYAAIGFIFIYSLVFAIFFNALIYTVSSELFPHFLRSKGMSLAVGVKSVIAIAISQITPVALKNISWKYYSVYIAFNAVAAVVFFFVLPETKGKTLEEIAALFGDDLATDPFDEIEVHGKAAMGNEAEAEHVETSDRDMRC